MIRPHRPTSTDLTFNPDITKLPRYNAGMSHSLARRMSGFDDVSRMASNENPHGCSPAVIAALASDAFEPWRYADPTCASLREALGAKVGTDPNLVVVGNGSEELVAAISRAFLVAGDSVLTVEPGFGLHEIEPLAAGATVKKVSMTGSFDFDLAALTAELGKAPQLLMLSSPWNPVGAALDASGIARLISATRSSTLFVLDEAYFEFAGPDAPDALAMLRAASVPFVVLRTFSKAYGLAGLRVGYGICSDPEIARVIDVAKPPFDVNGAAQVAALAALGDDAWMRDAVARIRAERERVASELGDLGFRVAPSQANFVFVDTGRQGTDVAMDLLRKGLVVKPWLETGYERFIRVTIGTAIDNDRLLSALPSLSER